MSDSSPATALLRHRGFLRFLYVRVAASVALQIQVVAVGWQMYALTGSPFRLGLIGLVQFIPVISLFPFTGHVADRYDRRIVTFIGEIVEALAVAVLAVAKRTGQLSPDLLLAMAFVVGTGRAFEQPSVQSVLPNIVPASVLPRAVAGFDLGVANRGRRRAGARRHPGRASARRWYLASARVIWLSAGLVDAQHRGGADLAAPRTPVDLKTLFSGVELHRPITRSCSAP